MPVTKTKKTKKKVAKATKKKVKALELSLLKVPETYYKYVEGNGWVPIPNAGIRLEQAGNVYQLEARRPKIGERYVDVWYPPNDLVTKKGDLKMAGWKAEVKYWGSPANLATWDDYQDKQKIPPERVLVTVTVL